MRAKVLFVALAVAIACSAKDIKTVVLNTAPEMHCSSFVKGVKDIQTNLEDKTVTIQYDADKTSVEKIIEGFKKIDYVATVADPDAPKAEVAEGAKKGGCCGSGGCKCGSKKKADVASVEGTEQAQATEKKGCSCCSKKKENN